MSCRRVVALTVLLAACSGEPDGIEPVVHDGGTSAHGCAPGEADDAEGGCAPAGVPPGGCGAGFQADGEGGCVPLLPAEPCAAGEMARPGEASCEPVLPCSADRWGDAPAEADAQYVDASYAGADSDGTEARPWRTIQDGFDAAAPGALVAVAAGTYAEDLSLRNKPVRLWGRCPEMVQVVGSADGFAAVRIEGAVEGLQLHGFGVTGGSVGIAVAGAVGVTLDHLWVHDTISHGIEIYAYPRRAEATVQHALVEAAVEAGILIQASTAELDGVVVRNTYLSLDGTGLGRGVQIQEDPTSPWRSSCTIRSSVIEGNRDGGIFAQGADLLVEGTVVRDTQPAAVPEGSFGILGEYGPNTDQRPVVVVRQSVLSKNAFGVAGGDAVIADTVLRDVPLDRNYGRGVVAGRFQDAMHPSNLRLLRSLVAGNATYAVLISGSIATVERTVIRDTQLAADHEKGDGLFVFSNVEQRSVAIVRSCVITNNHSSGVFVGGSDATVEDTVIADTQPRESDYFLGRAMQIQPQPEVDGLPASAVVRRCALSRNYEVGVMVAGAELLVEDTIIRDTEPGAGDAWFGDGISVIQGVSWPALATVRGVLAESNTRAGIANFGATVVLESSRFKCNAFALHGADYRGHSFSYEDRGNNDCACSGGPEECQVATADLQPPTAH